MKWFSSSRVNGQGIAPGLKAAGDDEERADRRDARLTGLGFPIVAAYSASGPEQPGSGEDVRGAPTQPPIPKR